MPSTDLQVLQTLYDNLYGAITYAPSTTQPPPFNQNSTMIQFASMQALNDADFAGAQSPINPGGSLSTAELFSRMVDVVPASSVLWSDSGKRVSQVYNTIVNGANTTTTPNPQQVQLWNQAYNYLNQTTSIQSFTGATVTQVGPTPIYSIYQTNTQSYVAALSSYRLTYNNYDLTDPKAQRAWQAQAPVLQAAINAAWNNLQQSGAAMVEEALNALSSSINNAISNAIAQAQQTMKTSALVSSTGTGSWYLAYATPTNWADKDTALANMTQLSISTSNLSQSASSSFSQWGGGLSAGWGLWTIGANAGGSSSSQTEQTTSTDFTMTANIEVVRIYRPWYDPTLFQMQDWFVNGFQAGGISDGKGNGVLPLVPTALIVARNFQLTGSFSEKDKSIIQSAVNGGASVGWGPFQIGGSYSNSSSQEKVNATFDGTTLTVPGMQVIGYVNAITPACPPTVG